jgi:hypothetical protein
MKRGFRLLPLVSLVLALTGCATSKPTSFSRVNAPGWATVEIREGVEYNRAWDTVFAILTRDFDFSLVLKEDGYMQTAWLYTWSGIYQENYRVRVTVKFAPDRKSLQFRSEAWALDGSAWVVGTDSRLMTTLKTDLMGTVGRNTR